MKRYHVGNCPTCCNGRLFLFREAATGAVYGHCEECEQGFRTPDDIERETGFLTLLDDCDAEWATEDEIAGSIWRNGNVVRA